MKPGGKWKVTKSIQFRLTDSMWTQEFLVNRTPQERKPKGTEVCLWVLSASRVNVEVFNLLKITTSNN